MNRVALVTDDGAESDAAAVFARARAQAGAVPEVYRALANAPHLLEAWVGLGWNLRQASALDAALGELAILRVACLTGSDYVWRSHYRMALRAGVLADAVTAVADWREADPFTQEQRAVLAVTDALTEHAAVSDEQWSALAGFVGDREAVELVLTISWYGCVARFVAGLAVPLETRHHCVPPVPRPPSGHG